MTSSPALHLSTRSSSKITLMERGIDPTVTTAPCPCPAPVLLFFKLEQFNRAFCVAQRRDVAV